MNLRNSMSQPWYLESYLFLFKLLLFSGHRIILALFRLGSLKVSKCPAQRGMSLICCVMLEFIFVLDSLERLYRNRPRVNDWRGNVPESRV